ncbi:MAG TPA: phage tail protein [Candidatus Limnocylindrales bacterium]|nr:phage tail protein [Candidatus Limnocylindrales bacterium]
MGLDATDVLTSFNFKVEIDSLQIAQFSEITGIQSEINVIEHQEKTATGKHVIHKVPGLPKPPTITLKRGKCASNDLWKWHQDALLGKVGAIRKHGSIVVYDHTGEAEIARWDFTNAWPSKISTGNLSAKGNEVLIEEVQLQVDTIERKK